MKKLPDLKHILSLATGLWADILKCAGIPDEFLTNKHGPCPLCGGKDRFRFDDLDARGTYYCNQCGPGDGFNLLKGYTGYSTKEALAFLKFYLGDPSSHDNGPRHVITHSTPIIEKALANHTNGRVHWRIKRRE